jgi:hypothetical protein
MDNSNTKTNTCSYHLSSSEYAAAAAVCVRVCVRGACVYPLAGRQAGKQADKQKHRQTGREPVFLLFSCVRPLFCDRYSSLRGAVRLGV